MGGSVGPQAEIGSQPTVLRKADIRDPTGQLALGVQKDEKFVRAGGEEGVHAQACKNSKSFLQCMCYFSTIGFAFASKNKISVLSRSNWARLLNPAAPQLLSSPTELKEPDLSLK